MWRAPGGLASAKWQMANVCTNFPVPAHSSHFCSGNLHNCAATKCCWENIFHLVHAAANEVFKDSDYC